MRQPTKTTSTLMGTLLLMALAIPLATAQVYKVTDKDGNVSYTDRPPSESSEVEIEQLEIRGVNSATPPPVIRPPSRSSGPEKKPEISYSTEISSPPDGTTIPMGGGNFGVGVNISPGLAAGEMLRLKLDGAPVGEPQRAGTWQLTNVFRGEHTITVERLAPGGRVVDSADPITVFVLRPGLRR